jgi:pyridoxine/pyridoxamine 5'-phosphate oxidase
MSDFHEMYEEMSMEPRTFLQDIMKRAQQIENAHLNLFALAFMQETGCKVRDMVLVSQRTPTGMIWYFKRRADNRPASE